MAGATGAGAARPVAGTAPGVDADANTSAERADEWTLFPARELFAPLEADPRWPRFAVEHQWRLGTDQFDRVGQVNLGETFALVQGPALGGARFELGLQAMVDALFDLGSGSFDLANEDYYAALTASLARGRDAALLRVSHLSSHVGDEYQIANGLTRESVSYEAIDLLFARTFDACWRVYGGAGVLLSPEPDIDPWGLHGGLEWTSPLAFAGDHLRPLAAVDVQLRPENDWIPEVAVLVALRLAPPVDATRHADLYLRFYHGRSLEGQFLRERIDSLGLGLRVGF